MIKDVRSAILNPTECNKTPQQSVPSSSNETSAEVGKQNLLQIPVADVIQAVQPLFNLLVSK